MSWQISAQGEAARIGSALAGRPLRIFSPAVSLGMTKSGYCGTVNTGGGPLDSDNDYSATAINALVNYANANRLIFDQHLNYTSLTELQDTVLRITGDFVDPVCGQNSPWGTGPDMVASLENGPIPKQDPGWWTDNVGEAHDFYNSTRDCTDPLVETWDEFVNRWFMDPNEFFGNFQLPGVFQAVSDANFRYLCVNATQVKIQNSGLLSRTVMGALIANKVNKVNPECVADPNGIMAIKSDYESAASQYILNSFNPHPEPCDSSIVCPPQ